MNTRESSNQYQKSSAQYQVMISIICAMGKNRAIGRNGKLLWKIPADLERFRKLTTGHPVIMGRKTYESIGKPLPGRNNIIISRNGNLTAGKSIVCNSIESAMNKAGSNIFIIGGGEIFRQTLHLAEKLYLTVVDEEKPADTFFPDYENMFTVVSEEKFCEHNLSYKFVELTR